MWFHEEEEGTVGLLLRYFREHPGTKLSIEFPTGESYLVSYFTSYDTDNEEAAESGSEAYDEYHEVGLNAEQVIKPGPHFIGGDSYIGVSYRDFPIRITAEDGSIVYQGE